MANDMPQDLPMPGPVSLQRLSTYDLDPLRQALADLLAPLGGMETVIQNLGVDQPRVLLKPNLLTGSRVGQECTTRPEIVQVVAEAVIAAGGRPFIGDSPAFGSARGVAEKNGLLPVCEALDLPIVEFKGQRVSSAGPTFEHLRISREALGADGIINLPKVKSHMQLRVTLGVKNLFGCVPGKVKAWWHMEIGKDPVRFGRMLVETALTIGPQLTIADGIIGHEGNGPSGGSPRALGLLAASPDLFALERVLLAILAADLEQVPVYLAAQELGVMPQLDQIPVLGPEWGSFVLEDWQWPERMMTIDFDTPRVVRSTIRHLLTLWGERIRA